ncbi:hypothetical protein U9M48_002454 [Paspalum notatum var. saurae]|uniref:Transposase MuDR plant domain-containing protein n=1 Tax=Paspalum notatum var. saurae TaxID=547442 RepID=A0AAQ3PH73_PASNO
MDSRVLVDDSTCLEMSNCICEGGVAEIYVENPVVQSSDDDQDEDGSEYQEEEEEEADGSNDSPCDNAIQTVAEAQSHKRTGRVQSREEIQKQIQRVKAWYSPTKSKEEGKGKEVMVSSHCDDVDAESSDSDFLAGDECSSEDDEESMKSTPVPGRREIEDAGNATPYEDSSEEEESLEDSDGNLTTQSSQYPRFNSNDPIPKFELGMKFRGKKQFKKAIIKHGMVERKLIKFYKNEATRMIAKCEWTTCAWRWQISSFIREHTCPPRRDNRLVTAKRVAEKYEKFILANPSWSLERMRQTIQEEMFADVSIPKLKRAKSIVLQKALDSTKGQYKHLYSYQEELLRSNPGSTVVIKRDTEGVDHVFQRMYICLDACKRGFKAGCRKVVGLDGCFFKGATNGELLCAIGRDANNQMYPIAWAVVEKENNDSWDWRWRSGLPMLNIGTVLGTYMPIGERSIRRRNGEALRYCAKAPCMTLFNLAKARLAKRTPQGAQGIMQPIPKDWSGAWFRLGSNCDSVDNNMCESFNKWIVEARFYPIITMLEAIRRKVMNQGREPEHIDMPKYLEESEFIYYTIKFLSCYRNGQHRFEVQHFANRFTVDLGKKQSAHVDIGGYPDYLALMPSHASFTRQIH